MKLRRPTRADIEAFCGIFQRQPGEKPILQQRRDDRAEERRREVAEWQRQCGQFTTNTGRSR